MSQEFHRGDVYLTRFWYDGNKYQLHKDVYSEDELRLLMLLIRSLLRKKQ